MRKLVSVLVAAAVFAGCGGVGGSAKPSTQAAATSGAPTGAAVRDFGAGSLSAGTYGFLDGTGTLVVPDGWEGCCDGFAILKSDYAGLAFADITDFVVYADACHWKAGPNPEPKDAHEAAMAFSGQKGHQGSQPDQVTLGGLPGWHVRLMVPANQPTTGDSDNLQFTGCDNGQFATWGTNLAPDRYQQGPSQIDDVYIVDVGDRTIVLDMVSGPQIEASVKAELDAMLASVKFR